MLLRCRDLWCCCYVICCYAVEIFGTIDAAWSAVKDFIPNALCSKSKDLLLYVKCWQWRYVNLHTRLQQQTISTLKRLLRKEKKKCPIKSVKNPHETRILPNSRARIWPNLAHKCAFYEHGSRSAGMYMCMYIYMYVCICICIYIHMCVFTCLFTL